MSEANPDELGNSGPSSRLANSSSSSSHIEDFLLKAIETPEEADRLAQALKNHQIRDCLRDRGIRFLVPGDNRTPNNKRLGFYSLPREIRDEVRKYVIASFRGAQSGSKTPKYAPLACIDSEWREAIEPFTFASLRLGRKDTCLADRLAFAKYVVGKRRQYLKIIRIDYRRKPALLSLQTRDQSTADIKRMQSELIFDLHGLFNVLAEWDVNDTGNGAPHLCLCPKVEIKSDQVWDLDLELEDMISELPHVFTIASFYPMFRRYTVRNEIDFVNILHTRYIFSLLSRMPNLRSTRVEFREAEWTVPLGTRGSVYDADIQGLIHLCPPQKQHAHVAGFMN